MPIKVATVVCACGKSFRSKLKRGVTTKPCPACNKPVKANGKNVLGSIYG